MEFVDENKVLKEKMHQLEIELAEQKRMTHHFEGLSHIMMAEMKKVHSVESLSKNERLNSLFLQFNNEMRGFLVDKQQMLQRFGRIENVYHSIVAILKCL